MPAPGFRRVIFLMGVHLRQCVECVQQSCIYGRHLHFSVSSLVYEPMALRIHKANPTPFALQSGSVLVSTLLGRSAYSPMEAHRELGAVTRSRPSSNQHTQLGVVHFYSHVPCPSSHVHTKRYPSVVFTLDPRQRSGPTPHHFLRLTFFRSLFMRYTKPYEGFFAGCDHFHGFGDIHDSEQ